MKILRKVTTRTSLAGLGGALGFCVLRQCIRLLLRQIIGATPFFGWGVEKLHSRGFGPYRLTPHTGVPKGSVCVHSTNSTFEVRQELGEAVLLTKLTTGCLRTTDGGNDDVPGYFMTFRS